MALAPFFGRQLGFSDDSLHSFRGPFSSALAMLDDDHSWKFAKEVSAVANTRVDWCETPEAHLLKADLPGLGKEDVKIQVEDGVLQISGERRKEEVQKGDRWHRVERAEGKFMRRFCLPEDTLLDHISAKVENGVLTITLPKQPKQQHDKIEVN